MQGQANAIVCIGPAASVSAVDCVKPEGYGDAEFWATPMRRRGRTGLSVLQAESFIFGEVAGRSDFVTLATGEDVAECRAGFFGRVLQACHDVRMIGGHIVLLADVTLKVIERLRGCQLFVECR